MVQACVGRWWMLLGWARCSERCSQGPGLHYFHKLSSTCHQLFSRAFTAVQRAQRPLLLAQEELAFIEATDANCCKCHLLQGAIITCTEPVYHTTLQTEQNSVANPGS